MAEGQERSGLMKFLRIFAPVREFENRQEDRKMEKERLKAQLQMMQAQEKMQDFKLHEMRRNEALQNRQLMSGQPGGQQAAPPGIGASAGAGITSAPMGAPQQNMTPMTSLRGMLSPGGDPSAPPPQAAPAAVEPFGGRASANIGGQQAAPAPAPAGASVFVPNYGGGGFDLPVPTAEQMQAEGLRAMMEEVAKAQKMEEAKNRFTIPAIPGMDIPEMEFDKRGEGFLKQVLGDRSDEKQRQMQEEGYMQRVGHQQEAATARTGMTQEGATKRTAMQIASQEKEGHLNRENKLAIERARTAAKVSGGSELTAINQTLADLGLEPVQSIDEARRLGYLDQGAQQQGQQQGQVHVAAGGGNPLTDRSVARRYMELAGGDKDRAQELALADGWIVQ